MPMMAYGLEPEDVGSCVTKEEFFDCVTIWHTHPSGMIGPSKGDLENLVEGVRYLVMTIPTKEVVKYERVRW